MMKSKLYFVSLVASLFLSACGGGGGGGSGATGSNAASDGTGIAGLAGSSCTVQDVPQSRMLDLDKRGYTIWHNLQVVCTLADGSKQVISGLPKSAFQFTGNGVTNDVPEDMTNGTSSADRSAVYLVQLYRSFAAPSAVTANAESLVVQGVDSLGRTVTAKQAIAQTGFQALAIEDLGQGVDLAASRVIDADGMGYTATTYTVAYATNGASSSAACPIATGVKDYPLIAMNSSGVATDKRYCLYTGMGTSNFYYTNGGLTAVSSWNWTKGADAGTSPSTLTVATAAVSTPTIAGLRVPFYKVVTTVRFPKVPSPSFVAVETGNSFSVPGWIYFDTPLPTTGTLATPNGAIWF